MSGRAVAIWCWLVCVLFFGLWIGGNLAADVTVPNPSTAFSTGKNLVVSSLGTVWVEAGGTSFFLLRNGRNVIYGVPGTPQLGQTSSQYFALEEGRQKMATGTWVPAVTSWPSFKIIADQPVTVTLVVTDKLAHWCWTLGSMFLVWLFGSMFIAWLDSD